MGNHCGCSSTDSKELQALNKMGIYTPKQIEDIVTYQWNTQIRKIKKEGKEKSEGGGGWDSSWIKNVNRDQCRKICLESVNVLG